MKTPANVGLASALYRGTVRHRRLRPRPHDFSYTLFYTFLDLSELEQAFKGRWLWSATRAALARFDRRDHFGDPRQPLDAAVRDLVAAETGRRPDGPIRLLTHLRFFGYVFNPVSFYYCYGWDEQLQAIVAEVNNTPWGERHCYVLDCEANPGPEGGRLRFRFDKAFHVSPFMPMDLSYVWSFDQPGEHLNVHMALHDAEGKLFDATLLLSRRRMDARQCAAALIAFPAMTFKVVGAIYWQALRLWLKRIPFHTHPAARPGRDATSPGQEPTS